MDGIMEDSASQAPSQQQQQTPRPTLEQTLFQFMESMHLSQQHNTQTNQQLINQIQAMVQAATNAQSTANAQAATNGQLVATRPREKLPTLATFDGKRSQFEGWLINAYQKLKTDGDYLGDQESQLSYVYACLSGEAQGMCTTWFTTNKDTASAEDLLNHLRTIYGDPDRKKRAMNALCNMEQKHNERFAKFLPRFETQLANAGALGKDDDVKIAWLERALNRDMRERLNAIYPVPEVYHDYISLLQTLALRADNTSSYKTITQSTNKPTRNSDAMDWEPTTRSQQGQLEKGRRAKRVTKEILDYRKENGLCLRCGNSGHWVPTCPLQPPQKSAPLRANVCAVKAGAEDLSGLTEPADKGEDSGKE